MLLPEKDPESYEDKLDQRQRKQKTREPLP